MAASVNNGHSVGRFDKPLMENGNCNFLTRPVYKRRRLSAVRDFPEGCGPSASRIDPVLKVDTADFGSANFTIVEDKNGEHSGAAIVGIIEDKNGEHSGADTIGVVEDKNGEHSEADTVGKFQCEDDSRQSGLLAETLGQNIECSLKNEIPVVSSSRVDGHPLGNDEPTKVSSAGMEALVDAELGRTEKPSSPIEEVVLSVDSKSLSPNARIAGPSTFTENMATCRHFPRRKVSAVRDFPNFCGRDAPCLSADEGLTGITSLNDKIVVQQNMAVDDDLSTKVAAITSLNDKIVVQQNMAVDDDLSTKVAATDMKEVETNGEDEYAHKRKLVDLVLADSEGDAIVKVNKLDASGPSSVMKPQQRNTKEKEIANPEESNHEVEINSKTGVKEANGDDVQVEGTSGLEIIVYPEDQILEAKPLQVASYRQVVLGVMAKADCPWRFDNGSSKVKLIRGTKGSNGKKADSFSRLGRSKYATKTTEGTNHSGQRPLKKKKENAAFSVMGQLIVSEKKDSVDLRENFTDFQAVTKSHDYNVNVIPFGHHNLSGHENDSNMIRHKVRETLRLFQAVARKLLQEVEAKIDRGSNSKRVDLQAAKILKDKGKYINTGKQILGPVPGVEVGDEFQYRVELNIIGLHRPIQGGIDYLKHNGKVLATSIVASGGYADDLDNSDVLIYTGQGGNVMNSGKEPEDQKLERGNLALKNSSEEKNPVRVIRGSESADGKSKTYVYDGLYVAESSWLDMGPHGKLVYRFRLRRIPRQPELALKEVKKSKKFKIREGLCVDDISNGIERIPVCAVNTIDDGKPPPFKYITSMIYPDCDLIPPEGCDCTNGCSDSAVCSCAVRNGGELPFNHNGAIVEAKPLVYECGPSCKCPPTCYNRVSQHGVKFQLEIFKTPTRGWGVRSLNSIPSGSFICEYIGELLEEKEAEQRTGNDEYLFDIGNNYSNSALWDGLSNLIPDANPSSCEAVKDAGGFTIDAAQYGNVGRFINHSCSPNLYAQNLLYDHHDRRMPHIMFFAAENIPPLQELTYDYNYMIDHVRDSDGNIKRKDCYCGSVECTGRMY